MQGSTFFTLLLLSFTTAQTSLHLKPSFTYLSFSAPLRQSPASILIRNTTMHILAKKCKVLSHLVPTSSHYLHLTKDLSKFSAPTYLKRNYNMKLPLNLEGLVVHGFSVEDEELTHVVVTEESSNDLYVLTMGVKYVSR
eukprot:TRINITY_DN7245_c0_g5_i2.p1 TRINITY_DN7245_c0_g5~~TRINITY_DN7245_c0_g5_i2.p1  ORF type:complete len:139 (-),score=19.71 TRINITY_DN7245_c0_g5_i2:66-482(-)